MPMNEVFTAHVARLFTAKKTFTERVVHAALGASGETGEIVDAVKKHWVYGKPLDTDNILEEAGDTLFYITALLSECGWSLDDAMNHNIEKLNKRYPEGFSPAAAIARADKESGQ